MSDMADAISDAVDKAGASRINTIVAISVAVTATFTALCNVKDGNIVQAMAQEQAEAVDAWAYYQSKSTKENIARSALDQLELERDLALNPSPEARALIARKLVEYAGRVAHYETDKATIQSAAEGHRAAYDRLNIHDDQFDMAEALMSIGIALFGVTALTQKRALLVTALVFAGLGAVMGLAGFLGLNLHPDFLAALLS
jgi:Domain of unknown function (DUF4337)